MVRSEAAYHAWETEASMATIHEALVFPKSFHETDYLDVDPFALTPFTNEEITTLDLLSGWDKFGMFPEFRDRDNAYGVRSSKFGDEYRLLPKSILKGFCEHLGGREVLDTDRIVYISDGIQIFFILCPEGDCELAAAVEISDNGDLYQTIDWYDMQNDRVEKSPIRYQDELPNRHAYVLDTYFPERETRIVQISELHDIISIKDEFILFEAVATASADFEQIASSLPLGVRSGFEQAGVFPDSRVFFVVYGNEMFVFLHANESESAQLAVSVHIGKDGGWDDRLDWYTFGVSNNSYSEIIEAEGYPHRTKLFSMEYRQDIQAELMQIYDIVHGKIVAPVSWPNNIPIHLVYPQENHQTVSMSQVDIYEKSGYISEIVAGYLRINTLNLSNIIDIVTITESGIELPDNPYGSPILTFIFDHNQVFLFAIGQHLEGYANSQQNTQIQEYAENTF